MDVALWNMFYMLPKQLYMSVLNQIQIKTDLEVAQTTLKFDS